MRNYKETGGLIARSFKGDHRPVEFASYLTLAVKNGWGSLPCDVFFSSFLPPVSSFSSVVRMATGEGFLRIFSAAYVVPTSIQVAGIASSSQSMPNGSASVFGLFPFFLRTRVQSCRGR